nr:MULTISPECIES: hypothetical protein [unclassified Rhodococcus (in: high G+C Gram-positive bacteria)]
MAATVSSAASSRRSQITTAAPFTANACADAAPIPRAAPVTMATLPSSE